MTQSRRRCVVSVSLLIFACCSALALAEKPARRPAAPGEAPAAAAIEDGISVYFSPGGGALAAVAEQINAAKKTIDVQAYLLTTKDLAGPLKAAHERGVKVRVLMDANNAGDKYSAATYFSNAGMSVWLDAEHKEAHN